MIEILLREDAFSHDIYALVKAFFPGKEVKTSIEEPEYDIILKMEDGARHSLCIDKMHELTGRKEKKDYLKRKLYLFLADITGHKLPWGTLTGIRPVKIPMLLMEQNIPEEQIRKEMQEKYLVSSDKVSLSIDIAKRERNLLEKIDYKKGYSIYIGIPFCPSTCLYCSFTSYPISKWTGKVDEYLDALIAEMEYLSLKMRDAKLNTVYIGGGTPTTLEPHQMDRLLKELREKFSLDHLKELTVEAGRPDSITGEKLEVMKRHRVTRISINPQTMNDKTLQLIGRRHDSSQIRDAFLMARKTGFTNINMDLIMGLPGETLVDVRNTLEEIKQLDPESMTIHSLALKRAAALKGWDQEYTSENTSEIMKLTQDYAAEMGMKPYYLYRQKNMTGNFENVGYSKVDKEGIYNILIMEEKQSILALGAGAATKVLFADENRIERVENVKDVNLYINRIDEMIRRKEEVL